MSTTNPAQGTNHQCHWPDRSETANRKMAARATPTPSASDGTFLVWVGRSPASERLGGGQPVPVAGPHVGSPLHSAVGVNDVTLHEELAIFVSITNELAFSMEPEFSMGPSIENR